MALLFVDSTAFSFSIAFKILRNVSHVTLEQTTHQFVVKQILPYYLTRRELDLWKLDKIVILLAAIYPVQLFLIEKSALTVVT